MQLSELESRDCPALTIRASYPTAFFPSTDLQTRVSEAIAFASERLTSTGVVRSEIDLPISTAELGDNVLAQAGVSSMAFNLSTDWTRYDIRAVTFHELGHVMGVGLSPEWYANVSGGLFVGPFAEAAYGGPVPLQPGGVHWAEGVRASFAPSIAPRSHRRWQEVDIAALRDIGYAFRPDAPQDPFPGFLGRVHTLTADVTGDGVADWVYATAEGSSHVKVYSGVTGGLVRSQLVYDGWLGGVQVAASAGRLVTIARDHLKVFDGGHVEPSISLLTYPGYLGPVGMSATDATITTVANDGHTKVYSPLTGELLESRL